MRKPEVAKNDIKLLSLQDPGDSSIKAAPEF